ncbi:MAG TPA: serine hydrolase [Chryseolinea sp.]
MHKFTFPLLAFLFCAGLGCRNFDDPPAQYHYSPPQDDEHEFDVSSLTAEGVDETKIELLTDRIVREEFPRTDGLLILRNNKLIYEHYFHGYSKDTPDNLFSSAKSITSLLAGIAIDQGFIESVDLPVTELLPEYKSFQNPDARKAQITLSDLLNMSSGLSCEDWYDHTEAQMMKSHDWIKFTLDLPMANDPGTTGSYCTGNAVTLGRIIENQSKLSLQEFSSRYLFQPLGVRQYQWHIMPDGKASAGGLSFMRPRDMAKIGLLMLNHGMFQGKQIVSPEWVDQCILNQIAVGNTFDGYGYLWWKQAFQPGIESYFSSGNGGQDIFIIPSKNLVLVFTGANQNTPKGLQNFQIIQEHILPAIL